MKKSVTLTTLLLTFCLLCLGCAHMPECGKHQFVETADNGKKYCECKTMFGNMYMSQGMCKQCPYETHKIAKAKSNYVLKLKPEKRNLCIPMCSKLKQLNTEPEYCWCDNRDFMSEEGGVIRTANSRRLYDCLNAS